MNYIDYMPGGGTADSTYYKDIPLDEKWGFKELSWRKEELWKD